MEVYGDSKCRIWGHKTQENKKRVTWVPLHTIKKYPSPL